MKLPSRFLLTERLSNGGTGYRLYARPPRGKARLIGTYATHNEAWAFVPRFSPNEETCVVAPGERLRDAVWYGLDRPKRRRNHPSGDDQVRQLERAVAEGSVEASDRLMDLRRRLGQWDPSDPANWVALAKIARQHGEFVYILDRDGKPVYRVYEVEVTSPAGQKWGAIRRSAHDFAGRLHTKWIAPPGIGSYPAGQSERIFPLYPGLPTDELTQMHARGAVGMGNMTLPGRMQEGIEEIPGLAPILRQHYFDNTANYRADASGATPLARFPRVVDSTVRRFRDLSIGQVFRFEHEQDTIIGRYSGSPYVKTGPRTYRSVDDPKRYGNMHPQVGVMVITPPRINPPRAGNPRFTSTALADRMLDEMVTWSLDQGRLPKLTIRSGFAGKNIAKRGIDRKFWTGEIVNDILRSVPAPEATKLVQKWAPYLPSPSMWIEDFVTYPAGPRSGYHANPRNAPRAPKGTPTHTNLYALADVFGNRDQISNQIDATTVPHIRRCLAAGLVAVAPDKKSLLLTDAGRAAIAGQARRQGLPRLEREAQERAARFEREREEAKLPPPPPMPEKIYFRVRVGPHFLGSPWPHMVTDNPHLAAVFDTRADAERGAAAAQAMHGDGRVETFFLSETARWRPGMRTNPWKPQLGAERKVPRYEKQRQARQQAHWRSIGRCVECGALPVGELCPWSGELVCSTHFKPMHRNSRRSNDGIGLSIVKGLASGTAVAFGTAAATRMIPRRANTERRTMYSRRPGGDDGPSKCGCRYYEYCRECAPSAFEDDVVVKQPSRIPPGATRAPVDEDDMDYASVREQALWFAKHEGLEQTIADVERHMGVAGGAESDYRWDQRFLAELKSLRKHDPALMARFSRLELDNPRGKNPLPTSCLMNPPRPRDAGYRYAHKARDASSQERYRYLRRLERDPALKAVAHSPTRTVSLEQIDQWRTWKVKLLSERDGVCWRLTEHLDQLERGKFGDPDWDLKQIKLPASFGFKAPPMQAPRRRPNVGPSAFIFAIGNGNRRPVRAVRRPNSSGEYRVKLPADRVLGTMPLEEARRRWPNIGLDVQVDAFKDFNRGADPHSEVILWDDRRKGVEAGYIGAKVPEMVYGGPAGSPPGSFKDSGGVQGAEPEGTIWVHESPNQWMVGRAERDRDGKPVTRDFQLIGDTVAKTGWLRR